MTASHTTHRRASPWTGLLLALLLIVFLGAGVAWPVAHLVGRAFTAPGAEALRAVLAAGRYRNSLVNSLALSTAVSVVSVLLSIWPEAHCLVLDEAAAAGVPVLAYALGALGERVPGEGWGPAPKRKVWAPAFPGAQSYPGAHLHPFAPQGHEG